MLHFIIANELHNLFYIMSAALLHLILAPHYIHKEQHLHLFFSLILSVFLFLYWNFADRDPLIYSLQLVPVCLLFVTLFVGIVPSIMTWIIFNIGCMFVLHYYWEPALLSSTFVLILGFLVRNRVSLASLKIKLTYATGILIVYELLYAPLAPYVLAPISLYTGYVVIFSFISLWIMISLLFFY